MSAGSRFSAWHDHAQRARTDAIAQRRSEIANFAVARDGYLRVRGFDDDALCGQRVEIGRSAQSSEKRAQCEPPYGEAVGMARRVKAQHAAFERCARTDVQTFEHVFVVAD